MKRSEYVQKAIEIFKNKTNLEKFLDIMAYTQKYSLYNQIEIYDQVESDIMALASADFWKNNMHLELKDDEVNNYIEVTNSDGSINRLYDINQIEEVYEGEIQSLVWSLNNDTTNDYNKLLDLLSCKDNKDLAAEYVKLLSGIDFIPDTLREPITNVTEYLLNKRMGFSNNANLEKISSMDINLLSFVFKASSNILTQVIEDLKDLGVERRKNVSLEDLIADINSRREESIEDTVAYLFKEKILSIDGLEINANEKQLEKLKNFNNTIQKTNTVDIPEENRYESINDPRLKEGILEKLKNNEDLINEIIKAREVLGTNTLASFNGIFQMEYANAIRQISKDQNLPDDMKSIDSVNKFKQEVEKEFRSFIDDNINLKSMEEYSKDNLDENLNLEEVDKGLEGDEELEENTNVELNNMPSDEPEDTETEREVEEAEKTAEENIEVSKVLTPQQEFVQSELYKGLENIFDKHNIESSGIVKREDLIVRLFRRAWELDKYQIENPDSTRLSTQQIVQRDDVLRSRLVNKGLPIAMNQADISSSNSDIINYIVENIDEIKDDENLFNIIHSTGGIEFNSRNVFIDDVKYGIEDRISIEDDKGTREYYLLLDGSYNRIIVNSQLERIDEENTNSRYGNNLFEAATRYDNKVYGDDFKIKYQNNNSDIRLIKGEEDLAYLSIKYDGLKYFDYQIKKINDWQGLDNYSINAFKETIKNLQSKHKQAIESCYEQYSAGTYSLYKEGLPNIDLLNSIKLENNEYYLITRNYGIAKYYLLNSNMDLVGALQDINFRDFESIKESIRPIVSLYEKKTEVTSSKNYEINDDNLGEGTESQRIQNNINALKTLNKIEGEQRNATIEEKEVLSKYVGWGGLSNVFKEDNKYNSELRSLLSDDEYKSARESSLTAFYTPAKVIDGIYGALDKMNVRGTRDFKILEPSAGIGSFIGKKPKNLINAEYTAIEKDGLSGRIAKALYPESNVVISGIEDTDLNNNSFNVAIGNVPFGDFKIYDSDYENNNFLIHDYFFAKTLDKVKPGGIVALITSSGTMDKKDDNVRKYLAERAELVGALRLPNNTFTKNAGTSVTSDIIFLKKRENKIEITDDNRPDWLDLAEEQGEGINKYFKDNGSHVLGDLKLISTQFGKALACVDDGLNTDIRTRISEVVSTFPPAFISTQSHSNRVIENIADLADIKAYSITLYNDELYIKKSEGIEKLDLKSDKDKDRVVQLIKIRDDVQKLLNAQLDDKSESEIKSLQLYLNADYDNFVKEYGRINQSKNIKLFEDDISSPVLKALEVYEKGEFKEKAKIFSERTIRGKSEITKAESVEEALLISLNTKAEVDLDYISSLVSKSEDEVIDDLYGKIYFDPQLDKYVPEDEYLSGNILNKMEALEHFDFKYKNINERALKASLPPLLSPENITVKLGANWIPVEYIKEFVSYLYDGDFVPDISYNKEMTEWNIANKSYYWYAIDPVGITDVYKGMNLIEDTLNGKIAVVRKTIIDDEGKEKRIIDDQKTIEIQDKQMDLKDKFSTWIWEDEDRSKHLIDIYNRKFNSEVNREYNGDWLTFPEMNSNIQLMKHQKNAVARIIQGGNSLLAHVVGSGKTFEMIASAMESKRLGLCNKSLIVVPKHLTDQTGNEFLNLYPNANILVATAKDFSPANRKEFCAKIATGNFDAIIIGQTQFQKIPMSKEFQQEFMLAEIENIEKALNDLNGRSESSRITIKNLEKARLNKIEALEKLNDDKDKDDVVTFEELGVDRLYIDEAHYYKNLYIPTKLNNVQGIGQSNSKRASDLLMKCRYMDKITNNKGVIFATGTPISNNISEMYVMQTYLQNDKLIEKDFHSFDGWVSNFAEAVSEMELTPEGTSFRMNTRLSKYINLPELQTIFREVADIKMQDDLDLDIPDHNIHTVITQPSLEQRAFIESLGKRAEQIRNGTVDRKKDNMLVITNESRKAGLDMRMIDPNAEDDPNGKVSKCAENIYKIWKDTTDIKGTQLMFSDIGVPGGANFDIYQVIKDKLIDYGVSEDEIAFIHDASTESQKDKLFEKVRSGKVRVLMGSTSKMGTGTNVQDHLVAMHDLDCPWRPSDLEQRMGRIVRQGNKNDEVDIYRYVTEKTFDSYLWQMILRKQKFITQVMTNKIGSRDVFDDPLVMEASETIAQCAGDPIIKEKFELDMEVRKLGTLKRSHQQEQIKLNKIINITAPSFFEEASDKINKIKKDIQTRDNNTLADDFSGLSINGVYYKERKEAAEQFQKCLYSLKDNKIVYRGFDIKISKDGLAGNNLFSNIATVKGEYNYSVDLGADGAGNITRIDNLINKMEERLDKINKEVKDMEKTLELAKEKQGQPFLREDEYREKQQRLNQIMVMLSDNSKVYNEQELIDIEDSINRLFEKNLGITPSSEAFNNPARVVLDEKCVDDNDVALYVNIDTLSINKEVNNQIISSINCNSIEDFKSTLEKIISREYIDYNTKIAFDPLEKDVDNDGVIARYDINDLDDNVKDTPKIKSISFVSEMKDYEKQAKENSSYKSTQERDDISI